MKGEKQNMNKLLQIVAKLFIGISMAAGVGVAVSSGRKASESVSAAASDWVEVTSLSGLNATDSYILTTNDGNSYANGSTSSGHLSVTAISDSNPASKTAAGVVKFESVSTNVWKIKLVSTSKYIIANYHNSGNLSVAASSDSNGWLFSYSSGFNAIFQKELVNKSGGSTKGYACLRSYNDATIRNYKASSKTSPATSNATFKIFKFTQTFTISYYANGGLGSMSSTVGENPAVASNGFTAPTGKEFSGWNTAANGGGTSYAVGATPGKNLELYAQWSWKKYSVSASITNGGFTGATGANAATHGTAYNATISADTANNYKLPDDLTITMGGNPLVNGTGYSYNSSTGALSITSPSGNIIITGECPPDVTEYQINAYATNGSVVGGTTIYVGFTATLTFSADDHYKLPDDDSAFTVSHAEIQSYNSSTGVLVLENPDDDVTVSVSMVAKAQNTISMGTLTGVSQANGNPTSVEEGATVTLTFTANEGYGLPTSSGVTVSGTGSSSTWTQGTGKLQITGGTGSITVSITGIARSVTSISLSSNSGSYALGDTFTMPTVTASYNVGASEDVTASATANGGGLENGVLTSAGTKTITISYGGQSATYTATVTAIVPSAGSIAKVTSTSNLTVGSTVYLVTEQTTKELSGITDSTYGAGTAYTTNISGLYPLTICTGNTTGSIAFANSDGNYLNWSGSKNTLNTNSTLSNNTSWTVSITNGNATIENVATSTRRIVWNAASSGLRFAAYNSPSVDDSGNSFHNVQLYKNYPAVVKTLKWITAEVKSGTYYQGSSVTASDFTVTAHYDDGTTSLPTTDITVTNGELINIGANEVTLSYSGKSCKVTVTAVEQTAILTGLSWSQGEYTIIDGQSIDFSKFGTVTAEYDDGEAYATKAISSCTVATYTKSGDVYTKVADLSDGATITSSSHGKYLGVSYTETNTFTAYSSDPIYVVEAIEDVFTQVETYTWTKVSSLSVGDTVVLTGTKADGTEPHELSGVTSNSGTIAEFATNPTGTYKLTVVEGSSTGSFAFKDEDNNYLSHSGTDKTLSLSNTLNASSSWTVEFDSETPTKATVTNVDSEHPLQYNPGNYFRVYSSASQQPIQFYKGEAGYSPTGTSFANTNAIAQKVVLEFASYFNDTMECVNGGSTSNVSGKWSDISEEFYNWFEAGDKDLTEGQVEHAYALFANAYSVDGGDSLQDMLARYDYIVAKYKLSDFLSSKTGRGAVAQSPRVSLLVNIIGENTNTVAIIVIISMVSVTAIGGYFFLRKRKENN